MNSFKIDDDLKLKKQIHVEGHNGSSIEEICVIMLVCLVLMPIIKMHMGSRKH